MTTRRHPFDRYPRETRRANRALRDYCLMGPSRSLRALHRRYEQEWEAWKADPSRPRPPTHYLGTLSRWSKQFAWPARAAAWDELALEEEKKAAAQTAKEWRDRRLKLIQGGFAKVVEALQALNLNDPAQKPRLGEVIQALRGIVAELRVEYGTDDEVLRAGIVGGGGRPVPPVVFVVRQEMEQDDAEGGGNFVADNKDGAGDD